jgi:hypothetical protein
MKLEVLRFSDSSDSTSGMLFEITPKGRKFLCYTLEDEYRDSEKAKVMAETRIPEGTYKIILRTIGRIHQKYSKRFADIHHGTLHVINVPNFKYILIHCGNTDEDTAGCLLLGDSQTNNQIKKDGFIGQSTQAYKRVYPPIAKALLEEEEVTITYKDIEKEGCCINCECC